MIQNSVLMDFDFVFDRDVSIYTFLHTYDLVKENLNLGTFLYNRRYIDVNVNPIIEAAGADLSKDATDDAFIKLRNTDTLAAYGICNTSIFNMLAMFDLNENIEVTIACKTDYEASVVKRLGLSNVNVIKKNKVKPINLLKFDTIYIRDYTALEHFNFENCDRKTIYIANIRCNFIDVEMTALNFKFMPIGMRNDVMVIDIYNFESKGDNSNENETIPD